MRHRFLCIFAATIVLAASAAAQQSASAPGPVTKPAHTIDGHPDLSGNWAYSIALPGGALKKVENGSVTYAQLDQSGRMPAKTPVEGALPYTPAPSYKPEFQAKVKYLLDREAKLDKVFYCGKPGVPRISSPRKIIQLPTETIFLYEDASGDPYRIIPTDGRPHRADADPSYYGDSIGYWEGNTFVVDSTNFVEDTWFGEGGYFHTSAMHVTERFWKAGENLAYQITVDDPNVLTAPWTQAPRVIKPSTVPLEESSECVEDDAHRMDNLDHHLQR
ncbi:MAG TPA: hypothetical protein VN822_10680 [Candidatus Acidoferrales bacterium]|nr:hypothetical protein [Candidatus Acidoferrales bacterium]